MELHQIMEGGEVITSTAAPVVDDEALIKQMTGALNFIMAFYDPGQRYLDTNAWTQAEAAGRRALAAGKARVKWGVS